MRHSSIGNRLRFLAALMFQTKTLMKIQCMKVSPFPKLWKCHSNHCHVSHKKTPGLTFHYTGCLIGILIMVYDNPYITGYDLIPNKSPKQPFGPWALSLLMWSWSWQTHKTCSLGPHACPRAIVTLSRLAITRAVLEGFGKVKLLVASWVKLGGCKFLWKGVVFSFF